MEFRHAVRAVWPSAATRPCLLSTTRLQFSTSSRLLSEAAAEAPRSSPAEASHPQQTDRAKTPPPNSPAWSRAVPRPPPIQRNTFFIDPKQRGQAQSQTQSQQTNNVTITDPAQLPSQIRADMEKHTTATTSTSSTISSIAAGLGSPGTLWKEDDFLQRYFGPQQADPRLRPSTGRTINVRGNIDPGRAFALLEKSCARNKVRNDMYKQREHERPGLKRKRLKSERWRTRFKFAMNAVIKRTLELRSQGW